MKLPAIASKLLGQLQSRLQYQLQPVLQRIEAMPQRDRVALLACGIAVVAGAEFMLLGPMAAKRALVAAAGDQEIQAAREAAAKTLADQQEQLLALQARAKALETELSDSGVTKAQGETVSALLGRALQSSAVKTVSLRSLPSEALKQDESAAAPAAAAAGTEGAAHGAPAAHGGAPESATAARPLYRHRYELVLSGEPAALSASAALLETGLAPLRIERVRMAADARAAAQLIVTFGLIGAERSWLNL